MNKSLKNLKCPLSIEKTVGFNLNKKSVVYLLCVALTVISLFLSWNLDITDSVASFMSTDSNTGAGFAIMEEEFTDLVTAEVVLENVSLDQCFMMKDTFSAIDGVYSVEFDKKSYDNGVGAFDITFAYGESDEASEAFENLEKTVALFDGGVSSSLDSGWWCNVDFGTIFMSIAAVIFLIIAFVYASRTYADVWVMLIATCFGIILNYGTSFGMSTVTKLTAAILQAALTMYYTALICRRYTKERKTQEVQPAIISAVSGSMPKIMAGAVIAVLAFIALVFADLKLGFDFALEMTKGILIVLVICITLLPCLIMSFAERMERSRHKALLPKIKNRGKFTFKTRYPFPILFALLAIGALVFTIVYPVAPYAYGGEHIKPIISSPGQKIENTSDSLLGYNASTVYMLVPGDDYNSEQAVVNELNGIVEVVSVTALSNSVAATYVLTDEISIWQFGDIIGFEESAVWNIYSDYSEMVGVEASGGVSEYEIPFIDVFMYTYDRVQNGSLTVNTDVRRTLDSIYQELYGAELQLRGEDYDRLIIEVNLPADSNEAVSLIRKIHAAGQAYYEDTVYLTGENGGIADMADSFRYDTILITILTVTLMFIILFVFFKSPGLALLLVLMVQGGTWLSVAVPYIFAGKLHYIGGMLGYTLQMLMGITYAAAMTNSYKKFKNNVPLKNAIGKALKENYSLIVITGCLMILSGLVIGFLSFDAAASAVGFATAIGSAINLLLALCVIPQTLLFWDVLVSKVKKTEIVLTEVTEEPVEKRMDIVEAIEKLKEAELDETQEIEIVISEEEVMQADEINE